MMSGYVFHAADFAVRSCRCADMAKWRLWAQGNASAFPADDPAPSFAAVPAGVRRRLSPLGRCAAAALAEIAPKAGEPLVCASSWGDVARTFALLSSLANKEDLSPADFALSVHNAIGAQIAIWLKSHAPVFAVAAGAASGVAALFECLCLLEDNESVLCLRYEEDLPVLWAKDARGDDAPEPVAWAVRLVRQKTEAGFSFALEAAQPDAQSPGTMPAVSREIRFLAGGTDELIESAGNGVWRCLRV